MMNESSKIKFQKDSSHALQTQDFPSTRDQYVMQYVQMIKEEGVISEVSTLLKDPDLSLVKRTIRVFANVYRYSLQLLSTGKLDEPTFSKAWPDLHRIGNELIEMLKNSENEGIIIHIVRYLEASVMAEILSDVTHYPHIASKTEDKINVGIKTLKDLITLPYCGGSTFIVGVRSIITIACYKNNIRKEVVDLIETLLVKPPPTLYAYHMRSLNKVLQKNLFRLFRREESPEGRRQLILMMGKVGVPQHILSKWSYQISERKRSVASDSNIDDSQKKKTFVDKGTQSPPLRDFPPASRLQGLTKGFPPNLPAGSQSTLSLGSLPIMAPGMTLASLPSSLLPLASAQRSQEIFSPHFNKLKIIFSNLRSKKSSKEEIICDLLKNPEVVELVMAYIDEVSNEMSDVNNEQELMIKLAKAGNENSMREQLSALFVKILPKSIIDAIHCAGEQDAANSVKPMDPRLKRMAAVNKETGHSKKENIICSGDWSVL